MKNKILTLILSFNSFFLFAQNLQWASQIGINNGDEVSQTVTSDPYGFQIYSAGVFYGTSTNLNPEGVPVIGTNAGGVDSYFAIYNQVGVIQFGRFLGGTGADIIYDIAVDSLQNIYICGFSNSPSFDADPSPFAVSTITGNSTDQAFIIKLTNNGYLMWAKLLGSTGSDIAYCLDLDANGNVVVGGKFQGTVDFDPGAGTNNLTATSPQNGFVLRLDENGNFISAAQIAEVVQSIDADSVGGVVIGGYFSGTKDFDPGVGVYNATAQGALNGYVCRLTPANDMVWANPIYGLGQILLRGLTLDHNGNVIAVGAFNNTIQMDPTNSGMITNTNGDLDAFVVKYNYLNGSYQWGDHFGGTNTDMALSVAADENGYISYATIYTDTIDADPGTGTHNLISHGNNDFYISRLQPNGQLVWANSFGNTQNDAAYSIHYQGADELIVCGSIQYNVDFDPTSGVDTINAGAAGYAQGFLGKYSTCSPIQITLVDTGCEHYEYAGSHGLVTYTTSGIYLDTLMAVLTGCDSIVTLQITITNIDTTVTQSGGIFTAVQNGAQYQWYTCPLEVYVPGATNQSFSPTVNGGYDVWIYNNGCTRISGCHYISNVGIEDLESFNFSLYPNPSSDYIILSSNNQIQSYVIADLSGRVVLKKDQINSTQFQEDISALSQGNYLIEMNDGKNKIVKKFIKIN